MEFFKNIKYNDYLSNFIGGSVDCYKPLKEGNLKIYFKTTNEHALVFNNFNIRNLSYRIIHRIQNYSEQCYIPSKILEVI